MPNPNATTSLPNASEQDRQPLSYLTQSEVAALLRLSPRTLERHRLAGTGPAYIKLGRRVVYKREAIEAWAAANTFTSTSAVGGHHG
jgi:predicted DNA-binding transcriptional regulator AlpA